MRAAHLLALAIAAPFGSCGYEHGAALEPTTLLPQIDARMHAPTMVAGPEGFDIIQRTRALYVAVRSASLEGPASFGRDVDDSMVHWNFCPGGTMVACAPVPGDTAHVGIPWPYHGATSF